MENIKITVDFGNNERKMVLSIPEDEIMDNWVNIFKSILKFTGKDSEVIDNHLFTEEDLELEELEELEEFENLGGIDIDYE